MENKSHGIAGFAGKTPECGGHHCWHLRRGPIWMVVKDGHELQECCMCPATRTVHQDHVFGHR